MMEKYWINESGYHDPTLAKVIENENSREHRARNKQIHDTIQEIKSILKSRDLELMERIQVKDKINKKVYR